VLKKCRDFCLAPVILALGLLSSGFALAEPLRKDELVGLWSGLKASQGFNGAPLSSKRTLQFLADGTYVSTNPDTRGQYRVDGNTVTLPNLYVLTYKEGILIDARGPLMRQRQ
jgi:hypothetical protein